MKGSKQSPSGKDASSALAAKGIKGGVESVRTDVLLNSFLHRLHIQVHLSKHITQANTSPFTSICRTPLSYTSVQPLPFLPVTSNLSILASHHHVCYSQLLPSRFPSN